MDEPTIRSGMLFNLDDLIQRRAIEGNRVKFRITRSLLLIALLTGCGEAERPRFVPAKGDAPAAPTADHQPGDRAPREGVIPRNIPMH